MEGQNQKDIQNITLHIYDTDIHVSIPKTQEEAWRKAAQLINDRLNAYYANYKGQKSDKEICYYAMIDIALKCVSETTRNDISPITSILEELSREIADAMK